MHLIVLKLHCNLASTATVHSENFARVLFSRNFADAKFRKNKPLRNGEITLPFTDIGKSCLSRKVLRLQVCLLTLFVKIRFS